MSTFDAPATACEDPNDAKVHSAPALELDLSRYRDDLDGLDLTEAQQTELLTTLWSIMQGIAQLGFPVDEVDICGSIFGTGTERATTEGDALDSSGKGRSGDAY